MKVAWGWAPAATTLRVSCPTRRRNLRSLSRLAWEAWVRRPRCDPLTQRDRATPKAKSPPKNRTTHPAATDMGGKSGARLQEPPGEESGRAASRANPQNRPPEERSPGTGVAMYKGPLVQN